MITKYRQIEANLEPPFIVEHVKKSSAKMEEAEAEDESADSESATEMTVEDKADKKAKAVKRTTDREPVEKNTPRELLDYVLAEGKKDFIVQRYKGLGEMTAEQLWSTTMNPETRTLLSVKLEDIAECETIFTTLMGEDVESRRKFIEDNALDVKNLDF